MALHEEDEPCRGVDDPELDEPSEPPNWEGPFNWHPDCVQCEMQQERGETNLNHTEHCAMPETHNWGCGCPTDTSSRRNREHRSRGQGEGQ